MNRRHILTEGEIAHLRSEIFPLAEAFDLIGDHIVITNTDGIILYANKAAEKHTGFLFDEMIGKNPGDLWGSQMPKDFYEKMWEQIKIKKMPFRGEVQNRNKDGMTYWQDLRIFPVLGEDEEAKFFIGMEPDITIRKISEEHKRQYIREMEQLNTYLEGKEITIVALTKEVTELKKRLQELNK